MPSILVTGAARGFGRALIDVYRERGWTLFPLVRSAEAAAELARAGAHPIVADVTDEAVEAEIARVLGEQARPLDLLVNNAGSVRKLRWLPATVAADIEDAVRVHCLGAFRCTRAALPWLRRAERATVVNVSSRFGSVARVASGEFRGIYSYSIAKAAQNMLTACLDVELRREGIRVLAVHPGRLLTEVGAQDADAEPRTAAERLAGWLDSTGREAAPALHDVMEGNDLPW